jgi:hypothetical protein
MNAAQFYHWGRYSVLPADLPTTPHHPSLTPTSIDVESPKLTYVKSRHLKRKISDPQRLQDYSFILLQNLVKF